MNQHGNIREYTWIKAVIGGKEMEIRLWVTKLGGQNIILGLPWLKIWNPQINWSTGEMEIPDKPTGWQRMANSFQKAIEINYFWVDNYQTKTRQLIKVKKATMTEEEKEKIVEELEEEVHICIKESISQQLEHQLGDQQKDQTIEELVPATFLAYWKVFEKEASQRFLDQRPWDHAINLKPDFVPKDCKIYPLTLDKQKSLDNFIRENLEKGYIRPSKSPMASPFFFVAKKEAEAK